MPKTARTFVPESAAETFKSIVSTAVPVAPLLSTPAYIMLVAYIIVGITILLPFELKVYNEDKQEFEVIEYNFAHRLLLLLYLLIPVCLHIYTVNCMMVGNCTVWSYAYTFIHIIWILVFVIVAFSYAFSRK